MEAKNEDIEVFPQPINLRDAEAAIVNLSIKNQVFEDRFVSIGEALGQITSGMKELQNSMKDLVFNRQSSAINAKTPPDPVLHDLIPNSKSTKVNLLQRNQQQPSRFQRFLSDRRNVNVRNKDEKPKVSKVDRRDSMIRNLDRLNSGQDDNVRVVYT